MDEIVRKLGLRMGLNDPINVRNHLVSLLSLGSSSACSHAQKAKLGRQDAGFGAWKSDEPIRPLCAEGNVRVCAEVVGIGVLTSRYEGPIG